MRELKVRGRSEQVARPSSADEDLEQRIKGLALTPKGDVATKKGDITLF